MEVGRPFPGEDLRLRLTIVGVVPFDQTGFPLGTVRETGVVVGEDSTAKPALLFFIQSWSERPLEFTGLALLGAFYRDVRLRTIRVGVDEVGTPEGGCQPIFRTAGWLRR